MVGMTDTPKPRTRRTAKPAEPVVEAPVEEAPKPAPAPKPAAPKPAKPSTTMVFKRRMSQGDHGPAVAEVQRLLAEHGAFAGPQDGRFGIMLARALREFQGSKNLRPTGEVDLKTWEALTL